MSQIKKTEDLPIFIKWMEFMEWLLPVTAKFPQRTRFTFANRIDNFALDMVCDLVEARYTKYRNPILKEANLRLEKLRVLFPVTQGIPFLGFRIFPGTIRLQRKTIVRFRKNVRKKETQYIEGKITENQLAASVQSMIAHISWANTFQMRQQFFN